MDNYTTLQNQLYGHLSADDGTFFAQQLAAGSTPTAYPLVGDVVTASSPDSWGGILQGGLWERQIKSIGPGATVEAFYDAAGARLIRPCGFVRAPLRQRHSQADGIPSAFLAISTIYLYADRSSSGRSRLELACLRIRQLTDGWVFKSTEGPMVFAKYLDSSEPSDTEEFISAIQCLCRIQFDGRYANEV